MIYVDMDQVLCDFDARFKEITGMTPDKFAEKNLKYLKEDIGVDDYNAKMVLNKNFWNHIRAEQSFWENLKPMKGFNKLWVFLSEYNFSILSLVPNNEHKKPAKKGKKKWI